jgi:hypothetical protein
MKRLLSEPGALGEPGTLATGDPKPGALLPPLAEPMLDELAFDMPALGNVASAVADGSRLNEVEDSALRGLTPPRSGRRIFVVAGGMRGVVHGSRRVRGDAMRACREQRIGG